MAFDFKQLRWVRLPFGGLIECVVMLGKERFRERLDCVYIEIEGN